MKVYHTTTVAKTLQIFREGGFHDVTCRFGMSQEYSGVWFADEPLDANDGHMGDTILSVDLPADLFAEHEWVGYASYRFAVLPAAVVNQYPRPKIHDHEYAVLSSRVELLNAIRRWEKVLQAANLTDGAEGPEAGLREHVKAMRDALAFFDEVGWQSIASIAEAKS